MKPIVLKANVSLKERIRIYYTTLTISVYIKILIVVTPLILLFGILNFNSLDFVSSMFLILFTPLLWLYLLLLIPIRIRYNYNRSLKLQKEVEWIISDEQLLISNSEIDEKWAWAEFSKFTVRKHFTFLHLGVNKNIKKFIPHAVFRSEEELKTFHELIRSKISRR
jgi:hypothetical protein